MSTAPDYATKEDVKGIVSGGVAELSEVISDLAGHLDKRFNIIEARLDDHDRKFVLIDKRFEEMDKRLVQLEGKFIQLEGKFTQLERKFTKLDYKFDRRYGLLATKLDNMVVAMQDHGVEIA